MNRLESRLAVVALVVLALPALLPVAEACAAIPCGRIYPIILIQTELKPGSVHDLPAASGLELDAVLVFTFDAAKDGYTPTLPNEPVTVTFEFPRKPQWVDMVVEPARIDVPVNDPTRFAPDVSDPAMPKLVFSFSVPIKISANLIGQPILRDGYDYQKLLVFAKSSESGIFQAGYGIKEIRVAPEGALHESDVAGLRDVYASVPLPASFPLAEQTRAFAGATVTFAPPATAAFWQPQPFQMRVDPAPAGRMMAAVHDEAGHLVAQTGLLDAASGVAAFNVTLVRPGLHTATLTLLPDAGTVAPPLTYAFDFLAGDVAVEGVEFPKAMSVAVSETVPLPAANRGQEAQDALNQFQRDVPFYAFDTAQGVLVTVSLPGAVAAAPLPGAANLVFSLLDPDGEMLQTATVDPSLPANGFRVGSVPIEGWYTLRIEGVGVPGVSRYDARIDVGYGTPPTERNLADGVADETNALLPRAGVNLTLPLDDVRVWLPSPFTPAFGEAGGVLHAVTVTDANGTLVQATRLRAGELTLTPPAPGLYRAFVHVQPAPGSLFSPTVGAFSFVVGAGETTVADRFSLADAFEIPAATGETLLGIYALPRADSGNAKIGGEGIQTRILGPDGATEAAGDGSSSGETRYVLTLAPGPSPGGSGTLEAAFDYASPVILVGPPLDGLAAASSGGLPVPGLAVGLLLGVGGLVAVGYAFLRRRA